MEKDKKRETRKKEKKNPFDSLLTYYDWEVKTNWILTRLA